jgi:membrane protease subunit (stomatin/prohibitin family)
VIALLAIAAAVFFLLRRKPVKAATAGGAGALSQSPSDAAATGVKTATVEPVEPTGLPQASPVEPVKVMPAVSAAPVKALPGAEAKDKPNFCPKCGNPVDVDADFCKKCGKKL